jgi:hypothetical protein
VREGAGSFTGKVAELPVVALRQYEASAESPSSELVAGARRREPRYATRLISLPGNLDDDLQ